jgi:ERCC4 domain
VAKTFRVARNPDADSTLPYVVELPLSSGPIYLKVKEIWPRTAKVYCHEVAAWPPDAEIVEEVGVRSCVRRGVAVDLVLDRARENRSQFVFTTLRGGRRGIFWQSARTTRKTRPGLRLPTARSSAGPLAIVVDTRERYAWKFSQQQATTQRRALPVGDYAVELADHVVGVVERKTLADLAARLVDGSLLVMLGELASVPRAAIVVEDRWADVFRLTHVAPSMVAELLAQAQIRYPQVPIVFCETRALAQEYAYRFLGAATAFAHEERAFPGLEGEPPGLP